MMMVDELPYLCLLLLIPVILIGVPIFVLGRGFEKFALEPLFRQFEGIELHDVAQPGDVCFVYHTYRGLIFWFTQSEHRVCTTPSDARLLLGRLLRFNLTWGLLVYGCLFVPFLAIGNYYVQKRSIERQERQRSSNSFGFASPGDGHID